MILNIGARIKHERKRVGITQKELAEKSGLATITIQQYERGVREPRLEIVFKIAKALNVLPTTLIENMDDEFAEFIESHPNDYDSLIIFSSDAESRIDSTIEKQLVNLFNRLNNEGIAVALERIEELTEIPRYKANSEKQPEVAPTPQTQDQECVTLL